MAILTRTLKLSYFSIWLSSIIISTSCFAVDTLENGLAKTPPMGWNSWNAFDCNINEMIIKQIADAMASNGMRDAGYHYVVIDDCWQKSRDAQGNIVADPATFPSGIKSLSDYVHSKGLKFGLYTSRGMTACQQRPGSRNYETQDARQYAAWGVDFVKADGCGENQAGPEVIAKALLNSGRPMVLSVNTWGFRLELPFLVNMWRTTSDITGNWANICSIIDKNEPLAQYARPGHWNDPDMLEIGNGDLTSNLGLNRAHLSIWAMMAAPLIAGCDLRKMPDSIVAVFTNREVIAIDQDSLGIQGRPILDDGAHEVWLKPLKGNARAVTFFNNSTTRTTMSIKWSQLGLSDTTMLYVRDLWQHKDLGRFQGSFSASVNALDVVVIRLQTSSDFTTIVQRSCNPMKISGVGKKEHYSLQGKLLNYHGVNGSLPPTGIVVEKADKGSRRIIW